MSSKLTLFNDLKAKIALEVPEIKTFRLFNNQFDKEGTEKAFAYPAVMVEFLTLDYITKNEGLQEANTMLMFHLGFSSLKTEDEEIFTLAEKLHEALQGFYNECIFSPLDRKRELQDVDHDAVIVWQIEYATLLVDNSGNRRRRLVEVTTVPDLDVIKVNGGGSFLKPSN